MPSVRQFCCTRGPHPIHSQRLCHPCTFPAAPACLSRYSLSRVRGLGSSKRISKLASFRWQFLLSFSEFDPTRRKTPHRVHFILGHRIVSVRNSAIPVPVPTVRHKPFKPAQAMLPNSHGLSVGEPPY